MKEIIGFPGYFITEDGRVWSDKSNRFIKLFENKKGYLQVQLYYNGHRNHPYVHRLVAKAFVENPNPENYNQVNHINGIKHDNNFTNLEWCNGKINMRSFQSTQINSITGFLGVRLEIQDSCTYYRTHWFDNEGKQHWKSFSVIKHGEEEAKRLAIEYRKEMEQLYYFKQDAQ